MTKAKQAKQEKFEFNAEVGKVLNLMINSLYTNKDIFLRELLSNASDACDKLRYQALTDKDLQVKDEELEIKVFLDKKAKTITISDNGIGLNHDDLVNNLGTVAKSGTEAFMKNLGKDNKKDVELIGQFGVGFYSAFMIADTVKVITNKAGEKGVYEWESDGKGEFTIKKSDEEIRGTKIILHVKKEEDKYLDSFHVKHIITTYSDHISFPIKLSHDENKTDETVNSANALWRRSKSDIKKEDYTSFYKSISHAIDDPWMVLHNKAEGVIEYINLLFIPSTKPLDLFHPDRKCSLKLYVKKVFITEDNVEIIPAYLRFLRGIVDSEDLHLNISRETMQNNAVIEKIKKALVKRVLGELKKKLEKSREDYEVFWSNFGAVLKEGLCEAFGDKDAILELCLFQTSKSNGKLVTLADYVKNMQEGQENIYYVTGNDIELLKNNPQMEAFDAKDIEVLFLTDPVDDFWMTTGPKFSDKEFKSISKTGEDLNKVKSDEKSQKKEEEKKKQEETELKVLLDFMKEQLKDQVSDVKISTKLTTSPVCLSVSETGMDPRMERMLIEQGQLQQASKKILEINGEHEIIKKINEKISVSKDDADAKEAIMTLFDQACILEGEAINNPTSLAKRISSLLESSLVA